MPGEEIQINFTGNLNNKILQFNPYILIAVDKNCGSQDMQKYQPWNRKGIAKYIYKCFRVSKRIKSDRGGAFIS